MMLIVDVGACKHQRCETTAALPPEPKPKDTNVVDHWGGAHPPWCLALGVGRVVFGRSQIDICSL